MNNYSILMYFSVSHNRPFFLLHITCVVWKPRVGDTGPPLVSELTKHGETSVQALPLCAPSSDVNRRAENRNNLEFTESRKLFQHTAMGTKCVLYSSFNTFAASYLNTQGLNNSCLKSPASTLVDLTFQSGALRSFSLNQLCNLSL